MAEVKYVKDGLDKFRRDDIMSGEIEPTEDDLETVAESEKLDEMEPQEIFEAFQADLYSETGWNRINEIRSMMVGDVIEFSDGRAVKVAVAGFEEVEL